MVYVLNKNGKPLMPTKRYAKIRILRKRGLLKIVLAKPFTVQLLYDTKNITQDVTLGIDSGYLNIGFSAITEKQELIGGEVKLLQGQKERLYERASYRRLRRQRLRYRAPRFNNRISSKKEGWLAPSIKHKLDSHIRFIEKMQKILPISKVVVEVANFDIQKIKNPDVEGVAYQQGEQEGFYNLREYILYRDGHKCQNPDCKNKDKSPILMLHHIVFREEGGADSPSNLITLCSKCHTPINHKKGKLLHSWMMKGKKVKGFKDSTFMSMVRWRLVNYLNSIDIETKQTYGFETKSKRIDLKLEKSHFNDAFCITGGNTQKRVEPFSIEQIRRNNRSLEKFYDAKFIDLRNGEKVSASELSCGRTTRNKNLNTENLKIYRGRKVSKGKRTIRKSRYFYQPNDLVKFNNQIYTIKGTHNNGTRAILKETGKSIKVGDLIPYRFSKGFYFKIPSENK